MEDVKNVPVGKVGAGVHVDPVETETTSIFSPLFFDLLSAFMQSNKNY